MKKCILICMVCVVAILGFFVSCLPPSECYEYREQLDSIPYNETGYNPIKAITYQYLSNSLGEMGTMSVDEVYIYSEDGTVKNQEIKIFGVFVAFAGVPIRSTIYAFDSREFINDVHHDPSDRMAISYDTSDHAIFEKLNSLNDGDTVYLKGRLRLYKSRCQLHEGYFDCVYLAPGIFIDSAEDITLTPKQDENN